MMNMSIKFIRILFLSLSIFYLTMYTISVLPGGLSLHNVIFGIVAGMGLSGILMATDFVLKKYSIQSFTVAMLGLLFGYLMGEAIILVLNTLMNLIPVALSIQTLGLIKICIYLISIYLAMSMTARAAEEIHAIIPFVRFKPNSQKKKDILIDPSILTDTRILDLASSGLLDHQLILPRFVLKELHFQSESHDENCKSKARRSLEIIKKLESISNLEIRYIETDFPEIKDVLVKLVKLARLLDANIMTADINRLQQLAIDGIRLINILLVNQVLKPITQTGECLNIKIQRYGKEARQGVGYLEDGTMVVVNGGAEFIGETIKAQVLSVKHTSSGRMIFCNTAEENLLSDQESQNGTEEMENSNRSYFALDSGRVTRS